MPASKLDAIDDGDMDDVIQEDVNNVMYHGNILANNDGVHFEKSPPPKGGADIDEPLGEDDY